MQQERFHVQYSHCGCPIPGDSIGSKLARLISSSDNAAPPSHLLPFNRPDLLSATHPSDHNAVHFQSQSKHAHKIAMRKYESLARKREHDIQKAAEKAAKRAAKDNSGKVDKRRPVYLSTLDPPHLQTSPQIRTSRDQTNARSPYGYGYGGYGYGYGYGFPFLVPVPIFFGEGIGLGGCVAGNGSLINSGCGGFNGGGACGNAVGKPSLFFSNYFMSTEFISERRRRVWRWGRLRRGRRLWRRRGLWRGRLWRRRRLWRKLINTCSFSNVMFETCKLLCMNSAVIL